MVHGARLETQWSTEQVNAVLRGSQTVSDLRLNYPVTWQGDVNSERDSR